LHVHTNIRKVNTKKPSVNWIKRLSLGGGAGIRTPDTTDMSRML
jgi:hypothetical protein